MTAWAEVIGNPVGHSLSPIIHRYWLDSIGIAGRYEATRVAPAGLRLLLETRRDAPDWRGCNVTAPHKEKVCTLLDELDEAASAVGAVNCVYRAGGRLAGTNTDVEGISEALAGIAIAGASVAIVGAGGAARAALCLLRREGAGRIELVLRRPAAARGLDVAAVPLADAPRAFASASRIINATPRGQAGREPMPAELLAAVRSARPAAAFDMVYRPLQTAFLAAASEGGGQVIDGLGMLIGQARRAFTLFYGACPPARDSELRVRLLSGEPR